MSGLVISAADGAQALANGEGDDLAAVGADGDRNGDGGFADRRFLRYSSCPCPI